MISVRLEPDGPLRDCLVVTPHQQLRVVNATTDFHQTGEVITVRWSSKTTNDIPPGATLRLGSISPHLGQGFHAVTIVTARAALTVQLYLCLVELGAAEPRF